MDRKEFLEKAIKTRERWINGELDDFDTVIEYQDLIGHFKETTDNLERENKELKTKNFLIMNELLAKSLKEHKRGRCY